MLPLRSSSLHPSEPNIPAAGRAFAMALARSRRVERCTPTSRMAAPLRVPSAELLEVRRLLSAAPVAVNDAYDLPDGRLAVDLSTPPGPLAFDESPSRWPSP